MNRPIIIYSIAALFSLLLSLSSNLQLTVINPDAICYLQSAQMADQGIHALMNVCDQARWPLYSLLIFATTKITHLSFLTSAAILNSFFTLISVLAFVTIIRFFTSKPLIIWLGALVILFAHEFNGLRSDIIRDHGFWAFYLISINCLLYYFRGLHWGSAIAWSISLIIATLFRIEGAFFLLLLPLITFCDVQLTKRSRVKAFLQLNALTILGIVMLSIWMVLHPLQDLSRLNEVQHQVIYGWHDIANRLATRVHLLTQYVLTPQAQRDSYLTLLFTLVGSYSVQVIENLSLLYAILVIYAWRRSVLTAESQAHWVLWGYVIVNLFVTFGFFAEYWFLSKRYLMALSLILMAWVPFALYDLIQRWQQCKRWLALLVILLVMSSVGGIVHFGYSKAYVHDAGDWLATNVPANALVYSNNIQLMYYSQHFGGVIFAKFKEFSDTNILEQKSLIKFDYLALYINRSNLELNKKIQDKINLKPIKVFINRHGDQIVIYKIPHVS